MRSDLGLIQARRSRFSSVSAADLQASLQSLYLLRSEHITTGSWCQTQPTIVSANIHDKGDTPVKVAEAGPVSKYARSNAQPAAQASLAQQFSASANLGSGVAASTAVSSSQAMSGNLQSAVAGASQQSSVSAVSAVVSSQLTGVPSGSGTALTSVLSPGPSETYESDDMIRKFRRPFRVCSSLVFDDSCDHSVEH